MKLWKKKVCKTCFFSYVERYTCTYAAKKRYDDVKNVRAAATTATAASILFVDITIDIQFVKCASNHTLPFPSFFGSLSHAHSQFFSLVFFCHFCFATFFFRKFISLTSLRFACGTFFRACVCAHRKKC